LELVYLWVEKNDLIEGTDFNFGSKYIFSFEKNDEKKRVLSVENNPDFIENFYTEKISISAIVGKNGTGKSQLLRLIWNGDIEKKQYFAILRNRDSKLIGIKDEKIEIDTELDIEWNNEVNTLTSLLYTNEALCLDSYNTKNSVHPMRITKKYEFLSLECYKKNIINKNSSLLEDINNEVATQQDNNDEYKSEMKEAIESDGIDSSTFNNNIDSSPLEDIEKIVGKTYTYENLEDTLKSEIYSQIINVIYDKSISFPDDINRPQQLSISINENRWDSSSYAIKFSNIDLNKLSISEKILIYYLDKVISYFVVSMPWEVTEKDKNKYLNILNKYCQHLERLKLIPPKKSILENKEDLFKEIKEVYVPDSKLNLQKYFNNLEKINNLLLKLEQKNSKLLIKLDSKNELIIKEIIEVHIKLLKILPSIDSILNFNLLPKMSSGNFAIMQTFAMLYDKINNIQDDNILLLLDEVEVYLHPNWQKKFLNLLIGFLSSKFKDKNFHIILATHSPFLLSDIPKSNVVFLGGGEDKIEQTFGANIHTLLSNSFFMEGSLMGAFADEKINNIIKFLNKKKTMKEISMEKEQMLKIIESIGEPFLKSKLLDMYNRRFIDDYKIREQKRIDEQISILQEKREKLDD